MHCSINGVTYTYYANALQSEEARSGYFNLANRIYGLNFSKWYDSGYTDGTFIPYVLFDKDQAVSSVSVCINDVAWLGSRKRYAQISTVMTLPEYRNRGLSRWLMETVLNEWKDKCNAVYLLANDSVVNFYPKFGFEEFTEYDYMMPVRKIKGVYRKLNIENSCDWDLIIKKYEVSNPFSQFKVKNLSQFVFHCLQFVSNDIYYLEDFDAVAIAKYDAEKLICFDVYTDSLCELSDIVGVLANESTQIVYLGFTPLSAKDFTVRKTQEEDYHLFVLKGKDNIFKENKVMFPFLSRA